MNGVVTWTPGDVTVAEKKGGLVSIVSTKEYSVADAERRSSASTSGCATTATTVEGMLDGDLRRRRPGEVEPGARCKRAAEISAVVYNERRRRGLLGEVLQRSWSRRTSRACTSSSAGRSVNNLADNLLLFGMAPGSPNLFGATYTRLRRHRGRAVPRPRAELLPGERDPRHVVRRGAGDRAAPQDGAGDSRSSPPTRRSRTCVSRKAWHINFDSGRATFTPDTRRASSTSSCATCWWPAPPRSRSTATPTARATRSANMQLSEARAFAVKKWLEKQAPVNFPEGRLRVFAHGQENPVAPNSTDRGPRAEPPRGDRDRHHRLTMMADLHVTDDRSSDLNGRRLHAQPRRLRRHFRLLIAVQAARGPGLLVERRPSRCCPTRSRSSPPSARSGSSRAWGAELITSFGVNLEALA